MTDSIRSYYDLITRWDQSFSLVKCRSYKDFLIRHIDDCAQLESFLPNKASRIIDVGSGAGLPGVVLALMKYENLLLCESNLKKAFFLEEVKRQLNLQYLVYPDRVEKMEQTFDYIVSRACSSLKNLFSLCQGIQQDNTTYVLLKGKTWASEVFEATHHFSFDCLDYPSQTNQESRILVIKNVSCVTK